MSFQLTAQYEFTRFDLSPTGDSNPCSYYEWNGKFYFTANDGLHGVELWVSDGTVAGTFMLKDIFPGATGSNPGNFSNINNKLFFSASHPDYGIELWVSDGTDAGTQLLKDVNPGIDNSLLTGEIEELNDRLYFALDNYTNGRELWSSDGTMAGTYMVKDIYSGNNSGFSGYEITRFNDKIYFSGKGNETYGQELWVSDGTTLGTVMLKDIYLGTSGSFCFDFEIWNNELYFLASSTSNVKQIWKTDGTPSGTSLFMSSPESIQTYYTLGSHIYFNFFNATSGNELWRSTTNPADKELVADIYSGSSGSFVKIMGHLGNVLYVSAEDNPNGGEDLYGIDIQSMNLTKLTSIQYLNFPSSVYSFTIYNNTVFFIGAQNFPNPDPELMDFIYEAQLYRTDGTQTGTYIVMPTIAPLSGPLNFCNDLFPFNDALFYNAAYDENGSELWRIKDFSIGLSPQTISKSTVKVYPNPSKDKVYIISTNSIDDCKIYNVEGKEINIQLNQNQPNSFVFSKGNTSSGLYFIKVLTSDGLEIHQLLLQD